MGNQVGTRIKQIREKKGITQCQLAKEIGYSSQQSIARIENSDNAPKYEVIEKIAKALKVNIFDLFVDVDKLRNDAKLLDEMGFDWDDLELIDDFHRLNSTGKQIARDRVEELTLIEKYTK